MSTRNKSISEKTTTQRPIERILSLLKGVKEQHSGRGGYVACCPSHNDQNPSLQIWEDQGDSHVGLQCFAGCERKAIVEAIGLTESDLYTDGKEHQAAPSGGIDLLDLAVDKAIHHHFLDNIGVTDGHKFARKRAVHIPYYTTDGKPHERYRIRTALIAKEGSSWSRGKASLIPYGLERLADARAAGYLVIVEGESDCWTLWTHGLPSLGIPGAALTSCIELHYLEGIGQVYVMQESDQAGRKFAGDLQKRLLHIGYEGEQYILDLSPCGAKDPNALHKRDVKAFKATFEQAMHQAQQSIAPADMDVSSTLDDTFIYLNDGVFCDPERTQLYRLEDGAEDQAFIPVKTRWGMPILKSVWQDNPRDDEKIDNHTYYTILLSGRPNQPPKTFTHYQIEYGKWAASFGGIAIARSAQRTMYANIIFEQQDAFHIPLEVMPEHTGIQLDEGTGRRLYVLRTGEHLHEDGRITSDHPPLARYTFDSESHAKHLIAWRHYEPLLPVASQQSVADLIAWDMDVDPSGNRLLLDLFSLRSLESSLVPIGTAIIAAAKDGTVMTDGGSGSGKTSAIDHARGVDGPTPYQAEQDAAAHGSLTGIETRIDPLRDCLVSISDFHFNTENPSEHEMRVLADKFDAFIRAVADNGEVKARGTKSITAAQGTRIKAGVVFDGETMPNLFLSRLRRAIVLQFERGIIDVDRIKNEWGQSQGFHTANGRAIIAWILTQVNKSLGDFVFNAQQVEQSYAGYLLNALQRQRSSFDAVIARSLATNYARLLTPIWMIEQAIGPVSNEQKQVIVQAVMRSLCAFADMIDNGGPSQITSESMLTMIKLAMEHSEGHVLAMDNSPLRGMKNDLLNRWGYERTMIEDDPWKPGSHGVHLANMSEDGDTLWFRSETLLEIVKKRALKEFPTFPYNQQTFPSFLIRLKIAESYISKTGERRNTWRERFNGALDRRLRVPVSILYPQDNEDEDDGGNSGNSGNNASPAGPTSQSKVFPLPVPASSQENRAGTDAHMEMPITTSKAVPASSQENRAGTGSGNTSVGSTSETIKPVPAVPAVPAPKTNINIAISTPAEIIPPHPERCSSCGNEKDWHVNKARNAWLCLGTKCTSTPYYFRDLRGQGAQKVVPSPVAQVSAPATEQDEQQQWVTIFADIHAGRALTEQGTAFTFPPDCSLSTFLAEATKITGVNRVFLCGARPGGDSAENFLSWLADPEMMQEYTTDRRGHFFDMLKPDSSVARYQHRLSKKKIDIRRITAWLGDDRDSQDSLLYTIEDARAALALVTRYLRASFPFFKHLSGTPSTTFKGLWTEGNRIAGKKFEPLSDEIRAVIHQNAGQGRIEFFEQHSKGKLPGLYYYDGIFMYAALTWGLPTEVATHDTVNEYAGKVPARYWIRYTVPADWQHVGLFMTKREPNGWFYPGASEAGQTFETWVDGSELDVAYNLPPGMPAWNITILERIVFKPEKDSGVRVEGQNRNVKPLATITEKIVSIRNQIDADKRQDAQRVHLYDLARGAVRNILLHGIGSFNREKKTRSYILLATEPAPAGFNRQSTYDELDKNRRLYNIPEESTDISMSHPEWAALIWARCRARMTRAALSRPYNEIITIRTDAIAVTRPVAPWEANTKVGQFRRKWDELKPVRVATPEEFDKLQHKKLGR